MKIIFFVLALVVVFADSFSEKTEDDLRAFLRKLSLKDSKPTPYPPADAPGPIDRDNDSISSSDALVNKITKILKKLDRDTLVKVQGIIEKLLGAQTKSFDRNSSPLAEPQDSKTDDDDESQLNSLADHEGEQKTKISKKTLNEQKQVKDKPVFVASSDSDDVVPDGSANKTTSEPPKVIRENNKDEDDRANALHESDSLDKESGRNADDDSKENDDSDPENQLRAYLKILLEKLKHKERRG